MIDALQQFSFSAQPIRAQITHSCGCQTTPPWTKLTTGCALNPQVHSLLQALSGKGVRVSLSGHSSLVALCSLVLSHVPY